MTMVTGLGAARPESAPLQAARALITRKRRIALAVPVLVLAYLVYVFFAFDVPGLVQRANMDNARILVADSYSHKVHVTRDARAREMIYAVEGEAKGRYPEGTMPAWVSGGFDDTMIDLGEGHVVRFAPDRRVTYDMPGVGVIRIDRVDGAIVAQFPGYGPGDSPDWASVSRQPRLDHDRGGASERDPVQG